MYSKIAIGNIKKSYKDYSIYFLTLILAVCIFYSFNSIYSQKALTELSALGESYANMLKRNMTFVSIFVSIILGGLILYSNNFLVKKRKKELGLYMSLGMGKGNISRILVIETFIVGVISLVVGIILGIGVSQVLSVFILQLLDVPMNEYQFVVSRGAIEKAALYFGIMFVFVMIFNVVIMSKYKIIDLLTAGRKNENMSSKNPIIYLISFVVSIIIIGWAYKLMLEMEGSSTNFKISMAIIVAGTFLFFFSLSGFMLGVVKKNKNIYLKGLNIFVLKQLDSKVKTNFISMSLICLMLFITIVVLATGISYKVQSELVLETRVPFDASIVLYNKEKNDNIEQVLKSVNFEMGKNEEFAMYNQYSTDETLGDMITFKDEKLKKYEKDDASFIKISDYNKILKLKDKKEVQLNKDEVLILMYDNNLIKPINEELANNNKINFKGKNFSVKNTNVSVEKYLRVNNSSSSECTIVINDEFLSNSKIQESILNVNYLDENRDEINEKYKKINEDFFYNMYKKVDNNVRFFLKDDIYSEEKGTTTILLFIGIYVGIIFLIASMAVLALQQLSEASDSIERYKSLRRIGANEKMINKTIFTQTLIYFSLPMSLAVVHSIVAISLISKELNRFSQMDISSSILITTLVFIVVYIGYFYTTYIGYKSIVKNNI